MWLVAPSTCGIPETSSTCTLLHGICLYPVSLMPKEAASLPDSFSSPFRSTFLQLSLKLPYFLHLLLQSSLSLFIFHSISSRISAYILLLDKLNAWTSHSETYIDIVLQPTIYTFSIYNLHLKQFIDSIQGIIVVDIFKSYSLFNIFFHILADSFTWPLLYSECSILLESGTVGVKTV